MLHVVSPPGEIIKPGDWKCIQDEGMPVHGRPFEKGNLYVHFKVRDMTGLTAVMTLPRKKGEKKRGKKEGGGGGKKERGGKVNPQTLDTYRRLCIHKDVGMLMHGRPWRRGASTSTSGCVT